MKCLMRQGRLSIARQLAALLTLAAQLPACLAANVSISANPATWRLDNYPAGQGVVIWFTGSKCTNGQLTLPAGSTAGDANRLWATVSLAKANGRKMFIYYSDTNAPAGCPIASFGFDAE